MIGLLFRFTTVQIEDGNVWVRLPGEFISNSGSGDLTIYGDVTFQTTIGGGLLLIFILVVMSLTIVNGSMLLWRRQRL